MTRHPKWLQVRNVLASSNPEKLIGYGRLLTVVFAIIAMYLDPTQPRRFQSEAQLILAIYATIAVVTLLFPIKQPIDSPVHIPFHLLDAAFLGSLTFLSNELTSPFFSFLPFTLLSMTIRWGFIGAVGGAVIIEITLLIVGIPDVLDGESELNFLIMRSAYFMVAAIMLAHFGAHRERNQDRLMALANWRSRLLRKDQGEWIDNICSQAAVVLGSKCVVVLWRHQDDARGRSAMWWSGKVTRTELSSIEEIDQIERAIVAGSAGDQGRRLDPAENLAIARLSAPQIEAALTASSNGYLSSFSSIETRGMIWALDPDCRPEDAKLLLGILAKQIGSELERLDLLQELSTNIRSEERVRLAQDLHDSVLQDMTATSIKLKALSNADALHHPQLTEIQKIVTDSQRRIRHFVEEQRFPPAQSPESPVKSMLTFMDELARNWSIAATFKWNSDKLDTLSTYLADIQQLVSEAASNAVRHGKATELSVMAMQRDDVIELEISDNGIGLTDSSAPTGSLSMHARVGSLGGNMVLNSEKPGLSMTITLPVQRRRP